MLFDGLTTRLGDARLQLGHASPPKIYSELMIPQTIGERRSVAVLQHTYFRVRPCCDAGNYPFDNPTTTSGMLQMREHTVTLRRVEGDGIMQRFEVIQMREDLWSVMYQGQTLYQYTTEEEARWAALALATNACETGSQASVVITPSGMSDAV